MSKVVDKVVSKDELAGNNGKDGKPFWIAINGGVYDVTKFAAMHPGGLAILKTVAGKDATEEFYGLHNKSVLAKYQKLKIGMMEGESEDVPIEEDVISEVPYAEMPLHRVGFARNPWFNDSHVKFTEDLRKFIADELLEEALKGEESGKYPSKEIYKKMGDFGIF